MKVLTIDGLVERDELIPKDIVTESHNTRVTATEWFRGEKLVRRDVWVNVLRGETLGVEART